MNQLIVDSAVTMSSREIAELVLKTINRALAYGVLA